MGNELIITADGSHTVMNSGKKVTYHSTFGAIQESKHVFVSAGLHFAYKQFPLGELNIFEMGFGTGLNGLLTLIDSLENNRKVFYEAVEAFPLDQSMIEHLNYCDQLNRPDLKKMFEQLHNCLPGIDCRIAPGFSLCRKNIPLEKWTSERNFHLIYYDAFDPEAQPELWSNEIFQALFQQMNTGGVLVTYSTKGTVKRALQSAGFQIEKLPGPRGKREILRAIKPA